MKLLPNGIEIYKSNCNGSIFAYVDDIKIIHITNYSGFLMGIGWMWKWDTVFSTE